MNPDEFKTLVKSKGTQAEVAVKIGYSKIMVESLCAGKRVILDRHVKAVRGLKNKK